MRERLDDLRKRAEEIRRRYQPAAGRALRCATGFPRLDAALDGGFVVAAIHELISEREGAAIDTVAWQTAARATSPQRWIIYVDTRQDLYPPGLVRLGISLGRLVVVRSPRQADALCVCEQALRCRAVGTVIVPLRSLDAYASRRLQLAAEQGGGLALLLRHDARGGPTFAASRLLFTPLADSEGVRRVRVTVLKLREGRPRAPILLEIPDAADSVSAHAAFRDGAGEARRMAIG